MEKIIRYLEADMGLLVNKEKSQAARVKNIVFLGFQILRGKIRVSVKARTKFKRKTRELTQRNNPLSIDQVIQELNELMSI